MPFPSRLPTLPSTMLNSSSLPLAPLALLFSAALPSLTVAADAEHFEKHIRPLLATKCVKCHGEHKQEGGLRLDTREALLKGGESGPALAPGKPSESLMLEALRYESFEMPPGGQLPESAVEPVAAWIAAGAPWPATGPVREATGEITELDRQWWAFQPLSQQPPPKATGSLAHWPRNEVDQFALARMQQSQLTPAPEADRRTLVRRLYFDLLGLPPSPSEVDAFLLDNREDAWERLIDRLLEDPRYGEHWARHWLDLVRYSESDGWNQDAYRPNIWRYRDYVINAFNQDMPYPQFVREQLAGDQLSEDNPDHLAAAGFLRLGIYEYNQRDARGHWNDIMNEMTDVAGDVFFGMSMACARCHDHKFDPVPQHDYFKLRAFFEPVIWRDDLTAATSEQRSEYEAQLQKWEEATAEVRAKIEALEKPYRDRKWKSTVDKFPLEIQACFHKPAAERNSWEQQMTYLISRQFLEEGGGPFKSLKKEDQAERERLLKELAKFDELKPKPLPAVMTVTDHEGAFSPTVIPDAEEKVGPGFLTVLNEVEIPVSLNSAPPVVPRRQMLAEWVGSPENPLTHRVMVNRVWQQHFGHGIVATPNDFGHNGQPPSHPELLDWLTRQYIESDWSMKQLHKLILTSATWRQSATHPDAARQQELDPDEALLWRAPVRRLRAEEIRDAMLSVAGELDPRHGGPSVSEATPRRAIYVKTYRNKTETFLHMFDMANGLKSVASRNTTTTPTQSLLMINGAYSLGRAKKLAARLMAGPAKDASELVRNAVREVWSRDPTAMELRQLQAFMEQAEDMDQRVVDLCHVLLNSNEFLYVD